MNGQLYDIMMREYSKESKETLIQRVMALEEIECSDRCFANQCSAGTSIYNINALFSAIDELEAGFTYEKAAKVYELAEHAKKSWDYIRSGLADINNDCRCVEHLMDFRKRVASAESDDI